MATSAVLAPQISQAHLSATYNFEAGFDTRDPDDALVDSARLGDTEAFARLMERYGRFCLSKRTRFCEIAATLKMKFRTLGFRPGPILVLTRAKGHFAPGSPGSYLISA
jgi:hypothetical protein